MGAPTVTRVSYGIRSSGGTDATNLATSRINVKSFILIATTGADTATIKDYTGNAVMVFKGPATAGTFCQLDWDAPLDGLNVALSTTNAVFIAILE
jgi:hypothetical protein